MIKKKIFFDIFTISFALCVIMLGLYALHFGISPVDESYYVSIPYGFALGNRPFIDEYALTQISSFYVVPFFRYYLHTHGSPEGIILFSRYVYFFSTIIFATAMTLIFRKITDLRSAILLSLPCIAFVFGNLYVLSYDTQALMFSTVGYFLGVLAINEFESSLSIHTYKHFSKTGLIVFLAGFFHAQMIISYPTLIFVPIVFVFCLMHFLPKKTTFIVYLSGIIIGSLWLLPILIHAGWHNLLVDWHYTKTIAMQSGLHKLEDLVTKQHWFFIFISLVLFLLCITLLTFFTYRFRKNKKIEYLLPWIGPVALLILLIPAAYSIKNWNSAGIILISTLSVLGPLLYFLVKEKNSKLVFQLLIVVWLPSFLAGILTTLSSNDFIWSSPIGLFPGALVTLFYMMLLGKNENKGSLTISFMFILPLIIFIGILEYYDLKFTFQDLPIAFLHSKVKIGPFKGLYTTEQSKNYYTQLTNDIESLSKPGENILYENFCGGSFFSMMKTINPGVRLFSITHNIVLEPKERNPDLIVKILYLPVAGPNTEVIPTTNDYITEKYRLVLYRKQYEIFQRN